MTRQFVRLGMPVLVSTAALVGALLAARGAEASTAIEYPDNWTAQFSKGGAWLADASDPIAVFYNPAMLATQANGVSLGWNLPMQEICFQRRDQNNQPTGPAPSFTDGPGTPELNYPETCNSNPGFPHFVPNLAGVWRVSETVGIGIAVVPPSSFGMVKWPTTVDFEIPGKPGTTREGPAPQRYLSLLVEGTLLFPTASFGVALTDDLRIGAGFMWGIASFKLASMSMSTESQYSATAGADNFETNSDNRSELQVKDLFVPGALASIEWSPLKNLDIAAWYKWMDKVRLRGDLTVQAPYFDKSGAPRRVCENGESPETCAAVSHSQDYVGANDALVQMVLPQEVRVGFRWHMPLGPASGLDAEKARADEFSTRDPLRDDLYDLELDLSWADNSTASEIPVIFDKRFAPTGLPSGIPPQSTRKTGWRDTFGFRLGTQYNAMRDRLGLRLGTWLETSALDAEYLNVTGVPALRGGVAGSLVLRFGHLDLEAGYMYVWNAGLDNEGKGVLPGIVGSAEAAPDPYKSTYPVNGGSISQHANIVSMGGVVRW